MPNQINVGGILRSADDYLALEQSLPETTSEDGNGGSFKLAGTQGSIEIIAEAFEEISVPDTKTLTISLKESSDDDSYSDKATLYTVTSDGGSTIEAGTELGRFMVPTDIAEYVKAVLTTDGTVTGSVNVFTRYVAR